ncbi:hypothetical protein AMTRI_Chr13g87720 [Amborella trichopoda]
MYVCMCIVLLVVVFPLKDGRLNDMFPLSLTRCDHCGCFWDSNKFLT